MLNRLTRTGALILLLAGAAWTQVQSGEVHVIVTDPSGLPLPGAHVSLANDAARINRQNATGPDGRFTFSHLPLGVYRLQVERAGFAAASNLVELRSSLPKAISVQMSVQQTSTEVDVSESTTLVDPQQAGSRYSIGSQQIQEQASVVPGRGVLDLINMQPGWVYEANGVLHPRGSEYQTQFVVDGMPMEENRSPAFAPGLRTNDVTEMTVLTGTYPAEYGRKLGGIIEVNTERDIEAGWHGSADTGGGSFGTATGSALASYGWSRTSLTLEASGDRTDRYLDSPVLGNYTNSGTSSRFGAAFDENVTERDRIHVAVHRSEARFDVPNENLQQAAGQRQDRTTPEVAGQFSWDHVFSANLLLNTRAYVEDLSANLWSNPLSTPVIAAQERGFRRSYWSEVLAGHHGHHEWKAGGDAFYAPVTEALQYQITDPTYFDPGTPQTFGFYDHRLDREQSLFAQDQVHWGNLTVSAGLRWDHYSLVVREHAFSPRLGVGYYFPKLGLTLHASYDRVFQTPATENLLLASSPQLDSVDNQVLRIPVQPSRGNFYEAGWTQALFGKFRLDASFYRRNFANYADDDVFLNTGVSFPISFRSAQIEGIDVKLDLPHWANFSGFLSYSNMLGVAQLPVTGGLFLGDDASSALNRTGSFAVTQDQRNSVKGRVRYQLTRRVWVAAVGLYGSGLPVELNGDPDVPSLVAQYGPAIVNRVNFSAGRVRPNFSLDLSAGADLWKRERSVVRAEVEVDNATDRLNVINFAGLFSGTAIAAPVGATGRLQYQF